MPTVDYESHIGSAPFRVNVHPEPQPGRRSPVREASKPAAWDTPALPLAMRRYLGGLRHEARPRRHLPT